MRRRGSNGFVPFLICLAFAFPAMAERRVALVVGNATYKNAGELLNPRNDAADIAAELKKLGFETVEGIDLDKNMMDRKIRDFAKLLSGADAGVFFYAGHGLQVNGVNYLVPVDAELSSAGALDWEMVRLDLIQRTMERETKTNVLFLDACRDNPLARNLARAMGTRSVEIGRGLAAAESGVGTLISYSTQPGNVALDGVGRNSPFAAALVKKLPTQGEDLSTLLIGVRMKVMETTKNKQVPWEHSALTGRFFFAAAPPAPPPEIPPAATTDIGRVWDNIQNTNSPGVLLGFRKQFGAANPFYDSLAANRLAELDAAVETAKAEAKRKAEAKAAELKAAEAKAAELKAAELKAAEMKAAELKAAETQAKVAALVPVQPPKIADSSDKGQLVRDLQRELKRIGCDPDATEGTWGAKSKSAVADFSRLTKLTLAIDEPTVAALNAVRSQKVRVCPLRCGKGQIEDDGMCIDAPKRRDAPVERAQRATSRSSDVAREQKPKAPRKSSGPCYSTGVLLTDEQKAANPGLCN